jgi:hypothetical protein
MVTIYQLFPAHNNIHTQKKEPDNLQVELGDTLVIEKFAMVLIRIVVQESRAVATIPVLGIFAPSFPSN